ncbi:hypothetical protein Cgig2_025804 [Carnegiea gigantea]|uniref:Uncharacterized protein n=1 Tax=Carnegiea gigantea TaxID=171969 RepID=A0A9Q1KE77_9CARY|nr:hypothetical protein Cgig2_025804 [Carnegiea gigantea]
MDNSKFGVDKWKNGVGERIEKKLKKTYENMGATQRNTYVPRFSCLTTVHGDFGKGSLGTDTTNPTYHVAQPGMTFGSGADGHCNDPGKTTAPNLPLLNLEAKIVEHPDNYRRRHAYCPKQDDYACDYIKEADPQDPNRAMEVIDDLVAQMREARDVLLEERNNQYWMEEEDRAVEDGMRAELDELKGVVLWCLLQLCL